jgi:hypothetical protein
MGETRYVQDTFGHVHIYQSNHEDLIGKTLQFCDAPNNCVIIENEVADSPKQVKIKTPPKFVKALGVLDTESLHAGAEIS